MRYSPSFLVGLVLCLALSCTAAPFKTNTASRYAGTGVGSSYYPTKSAALLGNFSGQATWWPNNVFIRAPNYQQWQPANGISLDLLSVSAPLTIAQHSIDLSITMQGAPGDVADSLYMCPVALTLIVRRGTQNTINPLTAVGNPYPIPNPAFPSSYYPLFNDLKDVVIGRTTFLRSQFDVWRIDYNSIDDATHKPLTLNPGDKISLLVEYSEWATDPASENNQFTQIRSCYGLDVMGTYNWINAYPY